MAIDDILIVSCLVANETEQKLLEYKPEKVGFQIQKYLRLFAKGIKNNDVNVNILSHHPNLDKIGYSNGDALIEAGMSYKYIVKEKNNYFPVIYYSYKYTKLYCKNHRNASIVCNVLNYSVSLGAVFAARVMKRQVWGIITDFPEQVTGRKTRFSILVWKLISICTGYIVLTEQMKEKLNPNKPAIVLEGHVDSDIQVSSEKKDFSEKKICIYAGLLHKKYGIEKLVKAFISADIIDSVLYVFGDGDYADELKNIKNDRIKYFGLVPNGEVVEYEKKASLLINPRPTTEEFTKYSFPSKNMEYMASGTPLLTTKLPGMPDEYLQYVYLFSGESIDDMAQTLTNVLSKTSDELQKKGRKAQKYVLENKNNIVQTRKLIMRMEAEQK